MNVICLRSATKEVISSKTQKYVSDSYLDTVFSVSMLSLHGLGQSLVLQVAKKASVLKRRKSKNKMDPPGTPQGDAPTPSPCDNSSDVVYYVEEPKAGERNLFYLLLLEGKICLFSKSEIF